MNKISNHIRKVYVLAIPIIFQNLIITFGQLIDNLMVGSIGQDAIAGVGSANMICTIIIFVGFGISEGSSIFIAQQTGAGKVEEKHYAFLIAIIFAFIAGAIAMLTIALFGDKLLSFYLDPIKDASAFQYGINYLHISMYTYFFILITLVIEATFRASKKAKYPLYATVIAITIHIILNVLLISGVGIFPALGVKGAAIALLISRIIELFINILFMYTQKVDFMPQIKDLKKLPQKLFLKMAKKTAPLVTNEFFWSFGQATLLAIYGANSAAELASFQISNTIMSLLFTVMNGFAMAVSILVGYNLGKKDYKKAQEEVKSLYISAVLTGIAVLIIVFILQNFLPILYPHIDKDVLNLSQMILKVGGTFFTFYILSATSFFILRAGGDTKGVLLMDSLFSWFVIIPTAYYLAFKTNLDILHVYLLIQLLEITKAMIGIWRVSTKKWIKYLLS